MSQERRTADAGGAPPASVAASRLDIWQPKTALGQRLLELRRRYIAAGGELLDNDGLDADMRTRRGGADTV